MYTLLIVDDEVLELETLRDYVDWDSLQIKVVATAKNGKEALAKALEYKPQIVLTDIKMPVMDGIQFTKQLRSSLPNCKIIFLTGYDDFNYAKSAISVKAIDYLLKPVDMQELYDVMNKTKESLDKDLLSNNALGTFIENCFKSLLIEKDPLSVDLIVNGLGKIPNTNFITAQYNLIFIYTKNDLLGDINNYLSSITKGFYVIKDNAGFIIILSDEKIIYTIETILKEFKVYIENATKAHAAFVYSLYSGSLKELNKMYLQLSSLKESIFYQGKSSIIGIPKECIGSEISYEVPSIEKALNDAIFTYNKDKVYKVIDDFIEYIKSNNCAKQSVIENVYNLLIFIWDNFLIHNVEMTKIPLSKNKIWESLLVCQDINDVKEIILSYVNKVIDYIFLKKNNKNQYVIERSIKYIEENYGKTITIDDLAKEIFLSPNYIRTIFKENTGETFLEYLTNVRLNKAKKLLMDKSLKVHEISKMVGYENVSYFCSLFAKKFSASPSDYRNKY